MKINIFLLPFLLAVVCGAASAQNQTRSRRVTTHEPAESSVFSPAPSVISSAEKPANHSAKKPNEQTANPGSTAPAEKSSAPGNNAGSSIWGNARLANGAASDGRAVSSKPSETSSSSATAPRRLIERTAMAIDNSASRTMAPSTNSNLASNSVARPAVSARKPLAATEEYRVGVGDVLDIRVLNMPTRESTLFTVLANGLIEYPLLNAPVDVAGLTVDEISNRLAGEIKVIDNAPLSVMVRDYASHAVVITGWVDSPGRKMLRREAMPLYTVLAEALPRAEASFATIVRNRQTSQPLAMNDPKAMATLLFPGDVVKISGNAVAPKQFVYVGGQVVSAGEKDFHGGMTLTQAVLASGGVARDAGKSVKISRRNADGFLAASEYDMMAIQEGRSPDPLIQAGDRIEVGRAVW